VHVCLHTGTKIGGRANQLCQHFDRAACWVYDWTQLDDPRRMFECWITVRNGNGDPLSDLNLTQEP
jgi:hypothetical protein